MYNVQLFYLFGSSMYVLLLFFPNWHPQFIENCLYANQCFPLNAMWIEFGRITHKQRSESESAMCTHWMMAFDDERMHNCTLQRLHVVYIQLNFVHLVASNIQLDFICLSTFNALVSDNSGTFHCCQLSWNWWMVW